MGLLQQAIKTYDAMEALVGIYEEGAEPLAPIAHIITNAAIEVTINDTGHFVEARAADKGQKIIIPVTEKSASRTSGTAAHPLCEKLDYLLEDNVEKHAQYLAELQKWAESAYSHPKVVAVLQYITGGTLASDLKASGFSLDKRDDMVCWRVVGLGADSGSVWTDVSLMKSYTAFYLSRYQSKVNVCMLTGENTSTTSQHLKGVFSFMGNAKIISANDNKNFTYRGRFQEADEAVTISYLASQKAHNALKWIISNQGSVQGNRVFVCWNPRGLPVPSSTAPFSFQPGDAPTLPTWQHYHDDLQQKLLSYQTGWMPDDQVVIAAFDAATTGRLAVTYYNELAGSDFWDRLMKWDETCCWINHRMSVASPPLYNIIAYAFGTEHSKTGKFEVDKKLVSAQMQRLISCRIDQALFPQDLMQSLVRKASHLQGILPDNRKKLLFITCAAIRKYFIDHQKGEILLTLEPERQDRSYQWGRMLAVMEKIERDTYENDEKREPNAIRMQSVFVQRPGYAFKVIMEQLKQAYYPRLSVGSRIYYDRLIGEIMTHLDADSYGRPLTETYLPGYYLQKNALYTRKNETETETELEEDSDEI